MAKGNNKNKVEKKEVVVEIDADTGKEKTVKMRFRKDMYYRDQHVPLYVAGVVYDVPVSMVAKWMKRGGEIYGAESKLIGSDVEETFPKPGESDGQKPEDQKPEDETGDLE